MKIITILVFLALQATVASRVAGLRSMPKGGAYDDRHSGQWMNARVLFQGIAALLPVMASITG